MRIERTRNAIRNTKWGLVQRLVSNLFPFIVRTVLIYTLSAEYAGLNSLFSSILSILSLAELGFSNAIVYSMYKPVAEDDEDRICALLNVYRKAYFIIGLTILGLGLILLPLLPYLISGSAPPDTNLYYLYLIYLVNTVISYFMFGYKTSLLSAYQREDVISKNTLLYNIAHYFLQCLVLLAFKNIYAYAIVFPLSTVLLNLMNNRAVNKMFPNYKPVGKIDNVTKTGLRKNLIGIMIWKIGGATRNSFDSIVVSMYLGLLTVAMYNNYFYIINGVITLLGVILTSITAGVGNKMAIDSPEENYEDFKKIHFYYMWISGWCTVCMMCLYQPFMKLWMGEEMMFSNHIMFLFCYYFIMMKQGDISSVYYQAAGLWWEGKFRSVFEAVINLALNLVLGYFFGVTGILVATIIAWTSVYFYGSTFVFTKYFKNGRLWNYYIDNLTYLLVTLLVSFCTFQLCGILTGGYQNQWIVILLNLLICMFIPNFLFAFIYGTQRKYQIFIKQIVGIVNSYILRRED